MLPQPTEIDELAIFTQSIGAVNQACNAYFLNQSDNNFAAVIKSSEEFIETFSISKNEHIKTVLEAVKEAVILKEKSQGEAVEKIREAVDIIEAKNLVLTYRGEE